ncbi:MAG: hypothetical protein HOW97_05510, partial [Catenulispora sp.]|nr:hypothetical protein [Catenulispora sp.]
MTAPLDFRSADPARAAATRPRPADPRRAHIGPGLSRTGVGVGSAAAYRPRRRRALTAWGVLLAVSVPTVLAAALDTLLTGGVHWIFGLVFVA